MMLAFAIDPLAQSWLSAMERACWQGGLALLVAWIICRVWRSMPGRAQCWVWRLAYAKLLLALVWSAPLNLHLLPPIQRQPVATKQVAVAGPQPVSFAIPDVRISAPLVIRPARRSIDWPTILLATWALGVGIVLALNMGRMVSTVRMRRKCEPVNDPQILQMCERIATNLGIKTVPPIFQLHSASSPMVVGPFRSAIVLPASALEQRRSRLELMLAHELAHYRRHDLLWNWPVALADVLL
ncbi:MAG TPA: M56 family metallopeptidase, partial [Tepidisphaeraceae bacterium]|nr:M56 family metallopeptidase [Tepidisphaeraceae bacterium]